MLLLLLELPLLPAVLSGGVEAVLPGALDVLSGVDAVDGLGGGVIGVVLGVLAIGLGVVVVLPGGVVGLRLQPASAAMIATAISVGAGR